MQAPADDPAVNAPQWGPKGANLTATAGKGTITLKWTKAPGAARYDVCRADPVGQVRLEDAVKVTRWEDSNVLAGTRYRYYVRAYTATGQGSPPSNTVFVELPPPDYMMSTRRAEDSVAN